MHHEYEAKRAELLHCPTADMLADALTKLSPSDVIRTLHDAMNGKFPHDSSSLVPVEPALMNDAGDVIPWYPDMARP